MTYNALKFSCKSNVRISNASVLVIQTVEVSHYLHHCSPFGLWNKPQQKCATGEGVSHENQEAELTEAVLDRKRVSEMNPTTKSVKGPASARRP